MLVSLGKRTKANPTGGTIMKGIEIPLARKINAVVGVAITANTLEKTGFQRLGDRGYQLGAN